MARRERRADYRRTTQGGKDLRIHVMLAAAWLAAIPVAHAVEPGQRMPVAPVAAPFEPGSPAVDLNAYKGKVLYVDVWASWCVPCRTSMPALEALYRKYAERGSVV